jgi:DNA-binding winged helix-turn-helix (wHTH) protein/tetratricopeptide (TPR) repeat protein
MKAFGPFRLDTVNHCLWRDEERVSITPKAFDVLRYLVEHSDRLVTQDELLEALWPETYVNPEAIRKYILEIRKALADRPDQPSFIETIPKRGYQFVAQITEGTKPTRRESGPQPTGNMVGRQEGLARLNGCLGRALSGQRQLVFITGEAGIGKTTLVDVFQQQASSSPNLKIARGQCIEGFGGIEAYYPMLEALGSLLQNEDSNSLVQMLAKRAPTWLIQFPALVKSEQKESLQREILGTTRERMMREICEALEIITAETPLMVVLEDLHWVDPSTLDLISALARRRESARLLLVGTYRPVDVVLSQSPLKALKQDLLVHNLCHEIAIECLEEPDVADYLTKTFASESIPSGFSNMIHHNSGGNPLFMIAIVQDMLNKGLITHDRGKLTLTAPIQEVYPGIPETLQQMLEIQLEQLSPEDRRMLQIGSVAGERFSIWAASAMLDEPSSSIENRCDALASRHRFIRPSGIHMAPDGSPSAQYEFEHSLYRQAFYRSLSRLNRSECHMRLGERLMPICAAGKPEFASELALHFEAAHDYERAARCLILAAENTQKRFSYRDSIQIFHQALRLISGDGPSTRQELKMQILQRIGDTQFVLGEMSASVESYEAAADLAAQAGLQNEQVSILMQMALPVWFIEQAHNNQVRGEQVLTRALQVSRSLSDPLLLAQTELAAACFRLLYDSWRSEDLEVCVHAEKAIRSLAGPTSPLHVYHIYVQVLKAEAPQALKAADAMIDNANGPSAYLAAQGARGLALFALGRFGEMLRNIRRERESARKNEAEAWMWVLAEAWLRLLCFDFEGVRRVAEITMSSDVEAHAIWSRTAARISAGYAEIAQKNHEKAWELFAQVRDYEITPKFFLHWHWRMHAELGATEARLSAGDLPNARREADGFLESALSVADPSLRALAWEINSRVARAENNGRAGREHIEKALEIVDRFEIPVAGWVVLRTAWDICRDEGDFENANRYRARAQATIMTIADSFEPDEPLRESFLGTPAIRRVFEEVTSASRVTSAQRTRREPSY